MDGRPPPRRPRSSGGNGPRGRSHALARVDGPRGVRNGEGRSRAEHRRRTRTRRRLVSGGIALALFVGVLFGTVFPTRTYLAQRTAIRRSEAQLRELRAEAAAVKAKQARLRTDAEIERRARADFGYVKPGEEAYNILPVPTDPIGLPPGWPFTGVEQALRGG